jgi:dihydrofolate synthase/folylpolyglutamate synthase
MRAIVARCEALNAPVIKISDPVDFGVSAGEDILQTGEYWVQYCADRSACTAQLNLRGRHQVTNALVAVQIAEQLNLAGFEIPPLAVVEGLRSAEWPGRLEMIRVSASQAPLLLDGAHNADGARALRAFLDEHFSSIPITMIFGAATDKAIAEMAETLFPAAAQVIVTRIASPRAAGPQAIAEAADRDVLRYDAAEDAIHEGLRITPPQGLIVVCGSLFLVGEVRHHLS